MGIVHKLKDEVVQFITSQKQDNPSLSCRGMATLVYERFQLEVSKSSVNTIFKSSHLSSSVGRRPRAPRVKKFHLPDNKKIQLTIDIEKSTVEADQVSITPVIDVQPIALPKPSKPRRKVPKKIKLQPIVLSDIPPAISVEPEAPLVPVEFPVEKTKPAKGIFYDGMGGFFLKAAAWDLTASPILGKLLSKQVRANFNHDLNFMGEAMLFSGAFGIKKAEEISSYKQDGFWALNGLEEPIKSKTFSLLSEAMHDAKELAIRIAIERDQLFAEAYYTKITLEDGSEVLIEPRDRTILGKNVQSEASASIDKSLENLSTRLIVNKFPLILQSIATDSAKVKPFYELAAAFENLPGKRISQVALLDKDRQEIAAFNAIPSRKRFFIAGAWPGYQEFDQLLKRSGTTKKFYLAELEQQIFYNEVSFEPEKGSAELPALRAFVLKPSADAAAAVAVLTNFSDEEMPAQDIIRNYILRWPSWQNPPQATPTAAQAVSSSDSFLLADPDDLWIQSYHLLQDIHHYFLRHFCPSGCRKFDFVSAQKRFYGLSGRLHKSDRFLQVRLAVPASHPSPLDLEYAVRQINESDIRNPEGQKLILALEPA